jgi:hypothetical protein
MNNIRTDDAQSTVGRHSNETTLFLGTNEHLALLLKRIETTLTRTNERLDIHEHDLQLIRNNQLQMTEKKFNVVSSVIHCLLILFVAIILKYI